MMLDYCAKTQRKHLDSSLWSPVGPHPTFPFSSFPQGISLGQFSFCYILLSIFAFSLSRAILFWVTPVASKLYHFFVFTLE